MPSVDAAWIQLGRPCDAVWIVLPVIVTGAWSLRLEGGPRMPYAAAWCLGVERFESHAGRFDALRGMGLAERKSYR